MTHHITLSDDAYEALEDTLISAEKNARWVAALAERNGDTDASNSALAEAEQAMYLLGVAMGVVKQGEHEIVGRHAEAWYEAKRAMERDFYEQAEAHEDAPVNTLQALAREAARDGITLSWAICPCGHAPGLWTLPWTPAECDNPPAPEGSRNRPPVRGQESLGGRRGRRR